MNILYLNNGLAGGGIEKLLNDMLPIVNKNNNCELLILSNKNDKYSESLKKRGIKVTVIPTSCKSTYKKIEFIKKYISNSNFDLIHANAFPMFYYAAIIKKILKSKCPPVVMTEHNTDNRRRHIIVLKLVEKWIYKSFSRIISISESTQISLKKWLSEDGDRFCVINNGIPTKDFEDAKPLCRNKISKMLNNDDYIICMVGTFTKKKNHKIMIPVMKMLGDDYKLICLGEGQLKKEIKDLADKNGLNKRIIFLGFHKNVAEIIKSSDVVVIPSIWEGFGLIAVEAMACGVPVIASSVPGLKDVVDNAGILVNPTDSFEIANSISLLRNSDKTEEMILKGKNRARDFDISKMIDKYLNVYNSVVFCKESE